GEKSEIWTWPIFRTQLPVTCFDKKGILHREKLAQERCILAEKRWLTPNEFQRLAGKFDRRSWKATIRCEGETMEKLIKVCLGVHRSSDEVSLIVWLLIYNLFYNADRLSDGSQKVFSVTCGSLTGKLHKERFATGRFCGKSIRTETSWMTPKDFATAGSGQTEALWKRDIQWEGKPLNDLIMNKMLHIHSVNCDCKFVRCLSRQVDQENDDECWACKSENGEVLVPCDFCPRAFHQNCHLPHVEDSQLGFNTCSSFSTHQTVTGHVCAWFPQLKNYSSFVTNPMWLCKVADKLQKQEYQTVGQFVSDVQLIFTNCATYHTVGISRRGTPLSA
uniref:Nuclear body protein SP140-like protein n=1 Tax=Salarias fasciatus TaxID=181472 RepID=A0A672INP6_SALFA